MSEGFGEVASVADTCEPLGPVADAATTMLARLARAGWPAADLAAARRQLESVLVRLALGCLHVTAARRAAAQRPGSLTERAHLRASYVEVYGVLDNLLHLANGAYGLGLAFEEVRPGRVRAQRFWDRLDRRNAALAEFLRTRTTEALLDERSWLHHLREFRDVAIHGLGPGPRRLYRVQGEAPVAFAARRPKQFASPEFHEVPITDQADAFLRRMAALVVEALALIAPEAP